MLAADLPDDAFFGVNITGTPSKEVAKLLAILQKLMPVCFGKPPLGSARTCAVLGDVFIGSAGQAAAWRAPHDKPTLEFAMAAAHSTQAVGNPRRRVVFADDPEVPFPFRGREVFTEVPDINPLVPRADESILATDDRGPVWTVSTRHQARHFRTAFGLSGLQPDENFVDVFRAGRFLAVLTLLHFLRVTGYSHLSVAPQLRAAFMFDDPNLHWPTYGCIDFREIAKRATRSNFHVAFATIPLDSWFTHSATAKLFHANATWLSLLIHGNNHARHELALGRDDSQRSALLRQALARIQKLEAASNLRVCRVMVPPHGACSAHTLAALPKHGYEGACISPGSLIASNPTSPWIATLGFAPAEIIEGCVVLPRDGFGGDLSNALLLNAYLGRPLIVRGHHGDLKDGVELLDEVARFINGLGDVTWSCLTSLTRSSYQYRLFRTDCQLLPLAPTVTFTPPSGTKTLTIQAPLSSSASSTHLVSTGPTKRLVKVGEPFETHGGEMLISRLTHPAARGDGDTPANEVIPLPKTAMSLILRRALTEGRDRFLRI